MSSERIYQCQGILRGPSYRDNEGLWRVDWLPCHNIMKILVTDEEAVWPVVDCPYDFDRSSYSCYISRAHRRGRYRTGYQYVRTSRVSYFQYVHCGVCNHRTKWTKFKEVIL